MSHPVSISEYLLRPRTASAVIQEEPLHHMTDDDVCERPSFPEMAVTDGSAEDAPPEPSRR